MSCILNHKKNITDKSCRITIFRMQKIVFSDHRLIYGFNQACGRDIYKFKCGRVEKNETQVCVLVCVRACVCVCVLSVMFIEYLIQLCISLM